MQLLQILLPVFDNAGQRFDHGKFDALRQELTERFGGVTAFVQSPAQGLWKDRQSGTTAHDDMILVEVMVETLDRRWWKAYRTRLEQSFAQDEIVIRAIDCQRL